MPGATPAKAERLRFGNAVFYWHDGQLQNAAGQYVSLRAKSLRMFAVLLSERGRVFSKDQLSELVWPDTVATDESIARCISDIRKALHDERHEIVQTYPKRGYCLKVPAAAVEARSRSRRRPVWPKLAIGALLLVLALNLLGQDFTSSEIVEVRTNPSPELRDTVVILPFRGSGTEDEFLASGLSEDLEIHLAELSAIRILSREQATGIAGRNMTPADLAREIDSRYIVQGALRHQGTQVALSIQLIDGADGALLWADRYQGPSAGMIAFRNEVPKALATAMSLELNARDRERLARRDTDNPEALERVMEARRALSLFTYDGNLAAEKNLRRAIAIDPEYAGAHAELASAYAIRLENDWVVFSQADTQKAFYFANRALELDPDLWLGHYALGRLYSVTSLGDTELALRHLRNAMELQPANDDGRAYYAVVLMMSGSVSEARKILEQTIASHPNPPFWYHLGLANAHFYLHDYEAALDAVSRCLSQMPNSPYCLRNQIATLARLGRIDDAEWTIAEYEMLGHDASLNAIMKTAIERDATMLTHLRQSYEMAGLGND